MTTKLIEKAANGAAQIHAGEDGKFYVFMSLRGRKAGPPVFSGPSLESAREWLLKPIF